MTDKVTVPKANEFTCPAEGCNKEDMKKKYSAMIEDFKKQVTAMLGESKTAYADFIKTANTNYDRVKTNYSKASTDIKNELLKGNKTLVESFQKNSKDVQKNLDDAYNVFQKDNMGQFAKNLTSFKEQGESAVQKFAQITSSQFPEVVKYLTEKQKTALDSVKQSHAAFIKELQQNSEDTAKKLTMTMKDLTPA